MWPDKGCTSELTLFWDSPLPCFPQLWRHVKGSLRILVHHFSPKGEWALTRAPRDMGLSPFFSPYPCCQLLRHPSLLPSLLSLQTRSPVL